MFKRIFTTNGGCGCGKPKPQEIFEPKPKNIASYNHDQKLNICRSSSSSWERGVDDYTSTTYSFNNIETSSTHCSENDQNNPSCSNMVSPFPKFGDSVAVIKDSEDPYEDFRQSMIQMILEKEIYSKDDLQELLNCFLHLNSPCHHEIIVKAFMEIWNGVVSKRPQDSKKPKNQQHQVGS